ncbi:MAG: hypothetical protein QOH86_1011, partial [Sphingomonadales bacterium]|nr:hypothetical protein [Sphingomonadales bacterium]
REERIRRWRTMNETVEREDVVWWRKSFVEALEKAGR